MKIILFIILVSAFFLVSCNRNGDENYDDLTKVKKGMKITEVNTIMTTWFHWRKKT